MVVDFFRRSEYTVVVLKHAFRVGKRPAAAFNKFFNALTQQLISSYILLE